MAEKFKSAAAERESIIRRLEFRVQGLAREVAALEEMIYDLQQRNRIEREEAEGTPKFCQADRDGECHHLHCPQIKDGEPTKTGRNCPCPDRAEDR